MQIENVNKCPVCSGIEFENFLTCEDHTYSHQLFNIQKCKGCGLRLTNPRPDQNSIGEFYQSNEYISHTGKSHSIIDFIYLSARTFTLKWKRQIISSHKSNGNLLDYGCGTGEFVKHMASHHWKINGIEPSNTARKKAEELINTSKPAIFEKLEELPPIKYDVISLWHVLEHVPHPDQLLLKLKSLLNPNGVIFVAVPNYESYDAQVYGRHWAAYDVPRHFWHFTKTTLSEIFIKQGYTPPKVIPMKLDAYYVSLLSEKYKNGGKHSLISPFKALLNGLKSNAKGRKNQNYSSLIYIAGHA